MAKITLKDLNYVAYELGIQEGRDIIKRYPSTDERNEPLDLLEQIWPDNTLDEFEAMVMDNGTVDQVIALVRNFLDGIEDGVRSGTSKWQLEYKSSYD